MRLGENTLLSYGLPSITASNPLYYWKFQLIWSRCQKQKVHISFGKFEEVKKLDCVFLTFFKETCVFNFSECLTCTTCILGDRKEPSVQYNGLNIMISRIWGPEGVYSSVHLCNIFTHLFLLLILFLILWCTLGQVARLLLRRTCS